MISGPGRCCLTSVGSRFLGSGVGRMGRIIMWLGEKLLGG